MAQTDTLILRIALERDPSIYRAIEIDSSKTLYKLAEATVAAFDFYFDHAFGFYSGLTQDDMMDQEPRYELFADMGDADPGVLSVKKTKVGDAFPAVGHEMLFLFDYGDEWLFQVTLKELGTKIGKTKYPRVVASQGDAPSQYEYDDGEEEDGEDDGPTSAINPVTGEKIVFRK
jgi:Plasmid pRiA4b ORF-3-like protein